MWFQWPPKAASHLSSKDPSTQFPTLYALTSRHVEQVRYPDGIVQLERSLKAFVSRDARMIKGYFSFLKRFSSTRDELQKQAQATQADIGGPSAKGLETPDDYPAHVHQTLYEIVKKYSQCCCAVSGVLPSPLKRHDGRLRLKENFQTSDDDVVFDAVFSRTPQREPNDRVEWQHLQFHIARYLSEPC